LGGETTTSFGWRNHYLLQVEKPLSNLLWVEKPLPPSGGETSIKPPLGGETTTYLLSEVTGWIWIPSIVSGKKEIGQLRHRPGHEFTSRDIDRIS